MFENAVFKRPSNENISARLEAEAKANLEAEKLKKFVFPNF